MKLTDLQYIISPYNQVALVIQVPHRDDVYLEPRKWYEIGYMGYEVIGITALNRGLLRITVKDNR